MKINSNLKQRNSQSMKFDQKKNIKKLKNQYTQMKSDSS
jgi:hypothetical protein